MGKNYGERNMYTQNHAQLVHHNVQLKDHNLKLQMGLAKFQKLDKYYWSSQNEAESQILW